MRRHAAPDDLLLDYACGRLAEGPALAMAVHLALVPQMQQTVDALDRLGGEWLDAEAPSSLTGDSLAAVLQRLGEPDPAQPLPPGRGFAYSVLSFPQRGKWPEGPMGETSPPTRSGPETHVPSEASPPPSLRDTSPAGGGIRAPRRIGETPALPGGLAALPAPLHRYLSPQTRWARQVIGLQEIMLPLQDTDHTARLLRIPPGRGIPRHMHEGLEYTVVISGAFHDRHEAYAAGDLCIAAGSFEHVPVAIGPETCIALVVLERPIVLSGPFGRCFNPVRWRRMRRAGVAGTGA